MRWYVSSKGEVVGPLSDGEIVRMASDGLLVTGMQVRRENEPWTPVEKSPFSGNVHRLDRGGLLASPWVTGVLYGILILGILFLLSKLIVFRIIFTAQ